MTALVLLVALTGATEAPLVVAEGTQAIVELPADARGFGLDLWDDGILEARLDAGKLLITGNAEGRGTLLFFGAHGVSSRREIRVVRENPDLVSCEICKVIGAPKDRGAKLRMVGDRVVIEGLAWSVEELERLEEAKRKYPAVVFHVALHPRAIRDELVSASYVLWLNGFPNLRAIITGPALTISGTTPKREKVIKLLNPFARRLQTELVVP